MPNLDNITWKHVKGAGLAYGQPNHLEVPVNMADTTWNTVASHEVFTVTGTVRMRFLIECDTTLTDAADGASIQFGTDAATNAFITTTGAAGAGGNTIEAGEIWMDDSPADVSPDTSSAVLDKIVTAGKDVGYEITGAALTGGYMRFICWWEPISSTGNVVAGAGGSL